MSNPDRTDATPDSFADLPLQPTGSGVADLEIAFEQMKLDEENDDTSHGAGEGVATALGEGAEAESEGHPS